MTHVTHGGGPALQGRGRAQVQVARRVWWVLVREQERGLDVGQRGVPGSDREGAAGGTLAFLSGGFGRVLRRELRRGRSEHPQVAGRVQTRGEHPRAVVAVLEHAFGFAQRPHQHVVGGLLATELFSLAALLRENHNLTVAGPARAAHALDRADGVDDVEEYDQVHARDVEALLPDGRGHQGVEGAVAESVEYVALLLLGLAPGSPGVAGARGTLGPAPAAGGIALADELRDLDPTLRVVGIGVCGFLVILADIRNLEHVSQRLLTIVGFLFWLAHGVDAPTHGHLTKRPDDVVDGVSERREHDDARVRIVLRKVFPDDLLEPDHLGGVVRSVARHRAEHILDVAHHRGLRIIVVV